MYLSWIFGPPEKKGVLWVRKMTFKFLSFPWESSSIHEE
jgi:hypothetical protein